MTTVRTCLCMVGVFLLSAGCNEVSDDSLLGQIQSRGTILVASDPGWSPQSERDEDGNWSGFDVLVAEEIAKRLGVTVDFKTPDWDSITSGNWRDQWDISVGSMTITTERKQVLTFIEPPYYYDASYFFVKADSALTPADIDTGITVCVSSASTWEAWLNGTLDLAEDKILQSPPATDFTTAVENQEGECRTKVIDGTYEFMVSSFAGSYDALGDDGLKSAGDKLFVEDLAVALDKASSKDGSSLATELQSILAAMHSDETLSGFSTQIYGTDLTTK